MNNLEIERKFLVLNDSYKEQSICHHEIMQGYLCKDPQKTVRVRIRDDEAFLTIKSSVNQKGIARFEWERPIDVDDARQLLQLAMPGIIVKTRWIVPAAEAGLVWEVDEFLGRLVGRTLAELELEDETQPFTKPEWLGEEVTGRSEYYNANM